MKEQRPSACFFIGVLVLLLETAARGSCNYSNTTIEKTSSERLDVNTTLAAVEAQLENTTPIGSLPNSEKPLENNTTTTTTTTELSLSTSTVTSGPNSTSDVTPSEFSTPTTESHSTTLDLATQESTGNETITSTANVSVRNETKLSGNLNTEVPNNTTEVISTTIRNDLSIVNITDATNQSTTYVDTATTTPDISVHNSSEGSIDFELSISSSIVPSTESVLEAVEPTSPLPSENSSDLTLALLNFTSPDENATSIINASHLDHTIANTSEIPVMKDDLENIHHSNFTTQIPISNFTDTFTSNSSTVSSELFNFTESSHDNTTTIWSNSPVLPNPTNSTTDASVADVTDLGDLNNETTYPNYDMNMTTSDELLTTATMQPWYLLQFAGNCTLSQEEFVDFEKEVRNELLSKTGVPEQNVTVNMYNCSKSVLVNVSVSAAYEPEFSKFFKKLDCANDSKLHINDETYLVTVVGPAGNNAYRQSTEVILSSRHTDIEFVIYVALGSACAFLLVLAVLLVTCKYCRTKPYKGFDVSDVSHLNLRLEDYTLTRIPRPKSIYADYCRGSSRCTERYCPLDEQSTNQTNGMVHAFDTSVVPLEDIPVNVKSESSQNADGVVNQKSSMDPEETEVNSIKSTENLHQKKTIPPSTPAPWGVDNESFAT